MKTTRRDLLLGSAAAGAAIPLLGKPLLRAEGPSAEDRILVFLQLAGGNDWLNTVIPAENAKYQAARPSLKVVPQAGLPAAPASTATSTSTRPWPRSSGCGTPTSSR
jgi:uncharacterized protein (DUF1501 family)